MSNVISELSSYKKQHETPEIRDWKRKWKKYYYSYMIAVGSYQSGALSFQEFMGEIKKINEEWKNG